MKTVSTLLLAGLATAALAARADTVELQHGFNASVGEAIVQPDDSSAYTYQVRGGMTLTLAGEEHALSADCVGLDVTDAGGDTVGEGHCVWRDGDDHRLFVSLQTAKGRNQYTVTGGTGKWQGTRGSLDTGFTYLPGPEGVYLGIESGSGTLERQP